MATFSTSLRITLISDGDEAGTWGQTTNLNLGTLLEKSIAGYGAVTTGVADQAFTINNGADDQARLACIALDTGTGAAFNVYAPPVPKQYVIRNVGSFDATLYNSTVAGNTTPAGVGVVIPAGKTMHVVSDGVDFFAAVTHAPSLTLGAALPVASGGTGATTAAAARTALGVPSTNSPALTGAPTAPTAAPGTNTTQIATTAFVQAAVAAIPDPFPTGGIVMWPLNSVPSGFLNCNGAAVSRTTYAALFAAIGTTYGAGDGSTTFNVPNFTDRFPVGSDGAYGVGALGGSLTTGLTTVSVNVNSNTVLIPAEGWGTAGGGFQQGTPGRIMVASGQVEIREVLESIRLIGGDRQVGLHNHSGNSAPHSHSYTPPYIGMRFVIKT